MLAVALDNFHIVVIDTDIHRVVRLFTGHSNTVTDMVLSSLTYLLPPFHVLYIGQPVGSVTELRTEGFRWSKVLLSTYPCAFGLERRC